MFRNTLFSLFFLCFWFTAGYSQELSISYENVELDSGKWETRVYMQSQAEDSIIIRAVNFSFLSDKSCATYQTKTSVFAEHWMGILERQFMMDSVAVKMGEVTFNHRLLYGIAEPQGMPGSRTLKIPGVKEEAMLVLQMEYKGECAQQIIMEDVKQNATNQIGDQNLNPTPYTLIHLGKE